MSIREKILQETENTPDRILIEVLDYLQYLKIKHQQGMMETALLSETILKEDWLKREHVTFFQRKLKANEFGKFVSSESACFRVSIFLPKKVTCSRLKPEEEAAWRDL